MDQTDSVVLIISVGLVQAGSVEQANTVGLFLTDSDGYDNTVGLLLTGGDGPFVFYCFIIYFNLYFFCGIEFRFIYAM